MTIQADRIDRLVAALRDCQLRLAAASKREAEMAEREASITWRMMETISRVNARIAPIGSKRRTLIRFAYRALRDASRIRSPGLVAGRLRSFADRTLHTCVHAAADVIHFHRKVRFDPRRRSTLSSIRVSIIIISNSHHRTDTFACLKSIVRQDAGTSYELIVCDESGQGPDRGRFTRVAGLGVLRGPRITECAPSSVGAVAAGEYLVFLENTALVTPGWLASLAATFGDMQDVGLAVPKLLHADGRLKEACQHRARRRRHWEIRRSRSSSIQLFP